MSVDLTRAVWFKDDHEMFYPSILRRGNTIYGITEPAGRIPQVRAAY